VSVYFSALQAFLAAASTLPAFRDSDSGGAGRRYAKFLHKEPAWSDALHASPCLVVAPRADLAERLEDEHLAGKVVLGLEVYAGLALEKSNAVESLQEKLDRREELRLLAYRPYLLSDAVPGQWDVAYDPAPNVARSWPDAIDMLWQLFTFKVETAQPRR
jgi:hypothetical protein